MIEYKYKQQNLLDPLGVLDVLAWGPVYHEPAYRLRRSSGGRDAFSFPSFWDTATQLNVASLASQERPHVQLPVLGQIMVTLFLAWAGLSMIYALYQCTGGGPRHTECGAQSVAAGGTVTATWARIAGRSPPTGLGCMRRGLGTRVAWVKPSTWLVSFPEAFAPIQQALHPSLPGPRRLSPSPGPVQSVPCGVGRRRQLLGLAIGLTCQCGGDGSQVACGAGVGLTPSPQHHREGARWAQHGGGAR